MKYQSTFEVRVEWDRVKDKEWYYWIYIENNRNIRNKVKEREIKYEQSWFKG